MSTIVAIERQIAINVKLLFRVFPGYRLNLFVSGIETGKLQQLLNN